MNIVTKIKRTKKGNFIIIDEGNELWIAPELIESCDIFEGAEVEYEKLMDMNYPFAYEKAMDMSFTYLSYCARSEGKMRSYLEDKKFDNSVIEDVISRLKELDYINDEKYIIGYIRQKLISNIVGKKSIKESLKKEGLSEELINNTVNNEYNDEKEYELLCDLVKKVYLKNSSAFRNEVREKAYSNAVRKGFEYYMISDAINEVSNEFSYTEKDIEEQKKKITAKVDKLLNKGMQFNVVYQKVYSEFLAKGAGSSMIKAVLEEKRN